MTDNFAARPTREATAQPRSGDLVLGSQGLQLHGGLVLGGIDGIRQRLKSSDPAQRIAALTEAVEQGQRGVNLVIRALHDRSEEVRQAAYEILQHRPEPKVRQALEEYVAADRRFKPLEQALLARCWQEADQETLSLVCQAIGVRVTSSPNPELLASMPCAELRIIDRLWVRASKGRFGFSVQRSIWQWYDRLLAEKTDVWTGFADRVGWRVNNVFVNNHWKRYSELNFSIHAPRGHLPFMGDKYGIFTVAALTSRLTECHTQSAADRS